MLYHRNRRLGGKEILYRHVGILTRHSSNEALHRHVQSDGTLKCASDTLLEELYLGWSQRDGCALDRADSEERGLPVIFGERPRCQEVPQRFDCSVFVRTILGQIIGPDEIVEPLRVDSVVLDSEHIPEIGVENTVGIVDRLRAGAADVQPRKKVHATHWAALHRDWPGIPALSPGRAGPKLRPSHVLESGVEDDRTGVHEIGNRRAGQRNRVVLESVVAHRMT